LFIKGNLTSLNYQIHGSCKSPQQRNRNWRTECSLASANDRQWLSMFNNLHSCQWQPNDVPKCIIVITVAAKVTVSSRQVMVP